jgi:hypothetical protein
MQRTMQRHCAVFRDGKLLDEGLRSLNGVIALMDGYLGVSERQPSLRNRTDGKPRRTCARRLSKAQ